MTAVMPRPATVPATDRTCAANHRDATDLYAWILSVKDWQVHALTVPRADAALEVATRCGTWHPVGCPVSVARRGEVCARCVAGGMQRLEVLPDRGSR